MKHKFILKSWLPGALLLAVVLVGPDSALAQGIGTAFTYQGYLEDGSGPVNDSCNFTFRLYDAVNGGNQVGPTVNQSNVTIGQGYFSTELDFGSTAITGMAARWLQIAVNCGSGEVALSPRQPLTPAPHALSLPRGCMPTKLFLLWA